MTNMKLKTAKDMSGMTCLVTGGTSGIGEVTATVLAGLGGKVVIVGRSEEKTVATAERIMRDTGNENVHALIADLSCQSDIHSAARSFRSRFGSLHLLINNAGALFRKRQLSSEGIEMTLALNHLAYFSLTLLLLDLLTKSAPSRIINVSSAAHRRQNLILDDLQSTRNYSRTGFPEYCRSKVANILFTYELARKLEHTGVTANAVHPGLVATNIFRSGGVNPILRIYFKLAGLSPEEGAATTLHLATSPEMEGVSGEYFEEKTARRSSSQTYEGDTARRLWQLSEELSDLKYPSPG